MRRLTAVDDCDRHKDTSPTADRTHQVGDDKQETEDGTAERHGSGDDALRFLIHRTLTVPSHDHLLVLELLGNVARTAAGDLNPGLGEDGAGGGDEGDVDERVDGVEEDFLHGVRGRHVVSDTGDGSELRGILERLNVMK